jgi:hypothetical protein
VISERWQCDRSIPDCGDALMWSTCRGQFRETDASMTNQCWRLDAGTVWEVVHCIVLRIKLISFRNWMPIAWSLNNLKKNTLFGAPSDLSIRRPCENKGTTCILHTLLVLIDHCSNITRHFCTQIEVIEWDYGWCASVPFRSLFPAVSITGEQDVALWVL